MSWLLWVECYELTAISAAISLIAISYCDEMICDEMIVSLIKNEINFTAF